MPKGLTTIIPTDCGHEVEHGAVAYEIGSAHGAGAYFICPVCREEGKCPFCGPEICSAIFVSKFNENIRNGIQRFTRIDVLEEEAKEHKKVISRLLNQRPWSKDLINRAKEICGEEQ